VEALAQLRDELDAAGTVSVWCGPLTGAPTFTHRPDAPHYAASMMKLAVLVAAHRAAAGGVLDLDEAVPVRNEFASAAPGAQPYSCEQRYDSDDEVWARTGASVPLRWLVDRMIVRSSNLATNLVLERVGLAAADEAWRHCGAVRARVRRGIEDAAAQSAGLSNVVSAADVAGLLTAIATDRAAPVPAGAAMLATLRGQQLASEFTAGLPAGTPAAVKDGWIMGVRHAAGLIWPRDAGAYVLAVCATTPLAQNRLDDGASRLVTRIAEASWRDRNPGGEPGV
jgi:beta-lactamase class A